MIQMTAGLMREFPDELRHAILHGQAAVPAADADALEQAIEAVDGSSPTTVTWNCSAASSRPSAATTRPPSATSRRPAHRPGQPWVHCRVGRAYLRLRRWADAEAAFRHSEQLDPDNPEAAYGLSVAVAAWGGRKRRSGTRPARSGSCTGFPLAHFQLGAVLLAAQPVRACGAGV